MKRGWILLALALVVVPDFSRAQQWPERTVKIIVPFPAGSTPDITARLIAEKLRARFGQPFIVENKPGAGGNIGTEAIAKSAPDGYTIGVSITGPLVNNKLLYKKMGYDPFKDLTPVTQLVTQPSVLVVTNELGVNSVQELIALLRKNPGKYNYASYGNGSISHLAMELLASQSGAQIVHVPYPGSPQAVQALLSGDANMGALAPGPVMPHVKTGKLKAIAVTSAERFPLLADVPTFKESGVPNVEATAWQGVVVPAGTPQAIVRKLHQEISAILRTPDVAEKLRAQYMEPVGSTPENFAAFMRDELARWEPIIRHGNITLD
jgi:tripartite-type tricarboxylate transporter receptor subunit TctC